MPYNCTIVPKAFQSLSVTLPACLVSWQGRVVGSIHSTRTLYCQVFSRWSDARPVVPMSHDATRRHRGTPEEATEERTQAGPQKGHKKGEPATGNRPLSAREGLLDKEGMAGHGMRKTPGSVRSCDWSRKMRWALTKLWVFCGIISKFEPYDCRTTVAEPEENYSCFPCISTKG